MSEISESSRNFYAVASAFGPADAAGNYSKVGGLDLPLPCTTDPATMAYDTTAVFGVTGLNGANQSDAGVCRQTSDGTTATTAYHAFAGDGLCGYSRRVPVIAGDAIAPT